MKFPVRNTGAIIINPQRFYTREDEEFIPDATITFRATSSYKRAGTDKRDIGADINALPASATSGRH